MKRIRNILYTINPHLENPIHYNACAKQRTKPSLADKTLIDHVNNNDYSMPTNFSELIRYYDLKKPYNQKDMKHAWDQYYLKLFYRTPYSVLDRIYGNSSSSHPYFIGGRCKKDIVSKLASEKVANSIFIPGIGDSIHALRYSYLGYNVLASDISAVAIEHQKKINQGLPMSLVHFLYNRNLKTQFVYDEMKNNFLKRRGKIEYMVHDLGSPMDSIDNESFGTILSCFVWQKMPKPIEDTMIKEHFRILAKGGILGMYCHNIPRDILIDRVKLLEEAGFIVVNISRKGLEYWLESTSLTDWEERQKIEEEISKKETKEKSELLLLNPQLKRIYFFLSSG